MKHSSTRRRTTKGTVIHAPSPSFIEASSRRAFCSQSNRCARRTLRATPWSLGRNSEAYCSSRLNTQCARRTLHGYSVIPAKAGIQLNKLVKRGEAPFSTFKGRFGGKPAPKGVWHYQRASRPHSSVSPGLSSTVRGQACLLLRQNVGRNSEAYCAGKPAPSMPSC